jgi:hypothetical protein
MLATNPPNRPQPEDIDWEALAGLATIPDPFKDTFTRWLQAATQKAASGFPSRHEKRPGWKRREVDENIRKAGVAFIRSLRKRVVGNARAEQEAMQVGRYLDEEVPKRRCTLSKRTDPFTEFARDLFEITYALGGSLTLNRTAGGTAAELFEKLRPALPRFIPKALPLAQFERLRGRARKTVNGLCERQRMELASVVAKVMEDIRRFIMAEAKCCPTCGSLSQG